jgi:hypothetical protein
MGASRGWERLRQAPGDHIDVQAQAFGRIGALSCRREGAVLAQLGRLLSVGAVVGAASDACSERRSRVSPAHEPLIWLIVVPTYRSAVIERPWL